MHKPFAKNPLEPHRDDHGVSLMFWFSISFLIVGLVLIAMRYFG